MNYYERHLGDYARDTGHLTPLEHGVYNLLLDRYYATETGIPADQAHRICRARSKDERDAVEAVLSEFFALADGVWTNARADIEIEKFRESEPERKAKQDNAKERQRRFRERRSALFEELRKHDVVPPFDASMAELETLLKRVTSRDVTRHVTPPVTRDKTTTQTPDTRHQSPEDQEQASPSSSAAPADLLGKPAKTAADPADLAKHKAERLAQVTDDAIAAFNASPLVKANGGNLAAVSPTVGREKRQAQVRRCLRTVRAICLESYGASVITADFWPDYWAEVAGDDFHAGRLSGGRGHENWKPDFEFLTREDVMLKVYDRAAAEDAA